MQLYVNSNWTERYANPYIAEAIAWSENGNHATISTMGCTAEEANAKLVGALGELNLLPKTTIKGAR
jgi:2'-5' RNA ligase